MASGELTAIADPYLDLSMNSPKPGSRAEQVQKRAWEAIKDIVTKEPEIYQRATRGPLLSTVLERTGSTKQTVYRWFRRYWQFGKCKTQSVGDMIYVGEQGKPKTLGDKKMGAPRTRMQGTGINVDDQVKALFRVAIEKCLLHEGEYELDYAYNQVLIAFGVPLPCKPEDLINVPTERQFRYFYDKEYSPIEITKKRKGEINYQKDFSPCIGHIDIRGCRAGKPVPNRCHYCGCLSGLRTGQGKDHRETNALFCSRCIQPCNCRYVCRTGKRFMGECNGSISECRVR